jgi:CheY-like chemotaxis protein
MSPTGLMNKPRASRQLVILVAEDDEDDRELVRAAFDDAQLPGEVRFVADGQALLEYLRNQGRHTATQRPVIILLDINMPRKDGREALAELKADRELCEIPVVMLTTSSDEEDIRRSYRLGASSFITKPTTYAGLVDAMRNFADYWFELVALPQPYPGRGDRR